MFLSFELSSFLLCGNGTWPLALRRGVETYPTWLVVHALTVKPARLTERCASKSYDSEMCRKGSLPVPSRCCCFTNVLFIPTHFVRDYNGKTGDYGLSREKKMHDVSEPYLMLCWIISAQKLPSLAPIAAANTEAVSSKNDAIRAYFACCSTFEGRLSCPLLFSHRICDSVGFVS